MKDFDRLRIRFRQFGGWRLAWEYVRLGLSWVIIKEFFRCVIHKRSFKSIYPTISRVVDPMLVEKYRPRPLRPSKSPLKGDLQTNDLGRTKPSFKGGLEGPGPYVWSCWLQGWENAPDIAKACLASLKRGLKGVEIVELDGENYIQWVTLPEYIVEKYKKGYIPHAMFSDMLRLQLLAQHGGVWIDSTVLYTGPSKSPLKGDLDRAQQAIANTESPSSREVEGALKPPFKGGMEGLYSPSWEEIINADLFVFQYTKPGHRWSGSLSNWFIASKKGNPFILTLLDMLFAYWKDYDVALEYYICHLFFNEVAKVYPEQILSMPYGWSTPSISLGAHLHYKFKEEKWKQVTSQVYWHKMTYRKEDVLKKDPDNYYSHIIKKL